jgi:hypothetical protein
VFLHLPVARSRRVRALFLATALVTAALILWIHYLRSWGGTHGLSPIFFALFSYFDSRATMWLLGTLVILLLVPSWSGARSVLRWFGEHPLLVAIASTVVMCAGALLVYRAHPLSMDEYAPVFQSQAFAAGHLTGQFPPGLLDWLIPRNFQNYFLNVSRVSGDVASSYWPSFALLLTPFTWLGISWACNPVLSGLSVIVIHRLALRLFDSVETAGLAVLFTIASPVFFADGISYYSMTAHMLFNGVFLLLILDATPRRLMLAGVAGSIALTLHNPVPHMLFAAPWIVWLATRERGIQKLSWLALGYLPLSLLLGVGWFWFSAELKSQGLGGAAVSAEGLAARLDGAFGWPNATILLARLVGVAKLWLWAVPGLLILTVMGGWKWRGDVRCRLLAVSAILTFAGFLFVPPDQGHGWGYRYFHSAWLVLPLLGAAALSWPAGSKREPAADDGEMTSFVAASALLMLVIGVSVRAGQMREFMNDHLAQLPAYSGSEPRVVFIDPQYSFYGVDLIQNDPFLRGTLVQMLYSSAEGNTKLMEQLHPGFRKVYFDQNGEVWSAATPLTQAHTKAR